MLVVCEGDVVMFVQLVVIFWVIDVLGYISGYVVYVGYFQGNVVLVSLFCGDIFFVIGCGWFFEGMFVQMCVLLVKLVVLVFDMCVYCVYEYMVLNVCFVCVVEFGNVDLVVWEDEVMVLWVEGCLIVFIIVGYECVINFFM